MLCVFAPWTKKVLISHFFPLPNQSNLTLSSTLLQNGPAFMVRANHRFVAFRRHVLLIFIFVPAHPVCYPAAFGQHQSTILEQRDGQFVFRWPRSKHSAQIPSGYEQVIQRAIRFDGLVQYIITVAFRDLFVQPLQIPTKQSRSLCPSVFRRYLRLA